jgi:hypothetical protein
VVWDGKSWEFEEDLISPNSSFRSEFHYSNAREGGRLLFGVTLGWVVGLNLGLPGVLCLDSSLCLDSGKCSADLYDYAEKRDGYARAQICLVLTWAWMQCTT